MHKSRAAWLSSLGQVREDNIGLNEDAPIAVKHSILRSPDEEDPPSYHPYFEFAMRLRGRGWTNLAGRSFSQKPYDILMTGSHQPHWGTDESYPKEGIVIYFLPHVLCDWGNAHESLLLLDRFSAEQPIEHHLVRPDAALRARLVPRFREMASEFKQGGLGHRMKLQAMLISMLVDVIRWEAARGRVVQTPFSKHEEWALVIPAIRYIRQNFSSGIYGDDIADAAGISSETRLREVFRHTLKIPWTKYLQSYRVHRAILLLKEPHRNITEIAYGTGFESLSHFNRTFKRVTGVSPSRYLQHLSKTAKK